MNPELMLKAQTLSEALPWLKKAYGSTVVIKYGGAAMVDKNLRESVANDIVLMKLVGLNPIIVHGGGNDISVMMEQLGQDFEFKDGVRVTSEEAMNTVKMVLVGKVNQEIVSALNNHGHFAVGISGSDGNTIIASQLDPALGRVGAIKTIDTTLVTNLVEDGFIPVIATVAAGDDGGSFNVNADTAAGALAVALSAEKIIFLTDVDGLYRDFDDKDSLVTALSYTEAEEIVSSGTLSKGMIPKVQACITALSGGTRRAHILNGTMLRALLLEIFTDRGVGTVITHGDKNPNEPPAPEELLAKDGGAA